MKISAAALLGGLALARPRRSRCRAISRPAFAPPFIGVYTPDRRNTQRVGTVPDVVVHPTIAGLIQGAVRPLALTHTSRPS
jgi:hypothetical protein